MTTWKFDGYPPVDIDDFGLGPRDAMNKAFAKASGTPIITSEDTWRNDQVRMDPTLADDYDFHNEAYSELRARNKYNFD